MSLSARRAWIEIHLFASSGVDFTVALRKESVDRNMIVLVARLMYSVALRKESVDRNNTMQVIVIVMDTVALRKESVDRNRLTLSVRLLMFCRSPQGERG